MVALFSLSFSAAAQTGSDPRAVSLAQQSVAALTGGQAVGDVTLNANVTSIIGPDTETGTAVFRGKGLSESRVDLNLSGGTISEARNVPTKLTGAWNKNGGTPVPQVGHNTVTDASWFFPALSSLAQSANPNYLFKYLGQVQHNGVSTQHIQVSLSAVAGAPFLPRLSATDFYLSTANFLPLAVDFNVHPDNDMNKDIPVEILFANYQTVTGVKVPFHFQKLLNGSVVLDATVTGAAMNTGVPDTTFTLP
jgi:hypothetical protein